MEQSDILNRFKLQFRQFFEESLKTSPMVFGLEVPKEWYPIIYNMCFLIEQECENGGIQLEWAQIKEKFGSLRAYFDIIEKPGGISDVEYDMALDAIDSIISRAEELTIAAERLYERAFWDIPV